MESNLQRRKLKNGTENFCESHDVTPVHWGSIKGRGGGVNSHEALEKCFLDCDYY